MAESSQQQRLSPRHTAGSLDSLGLPEIVQTVALGAKTGRVTIRSGGRVGLIWFETGAAVHAEADTMTGDDAFLEIVGWREGSFLLELDVTTTRRTIENDAMFLVLEGVRRRDEELEHAGPDDSIAASLDAVFDDEPATGSRRGPWPRIAFVVATVAIAVACGGVLVRSPLFANAAPPEPEQILVVTGRHGTGKIPTEIVGPAPTPVEPAAVPIVSRPSTPAPEPVVEVAVELPSEPEPPPAILDLPTATLELGVTSKLRGARLRLLWNGEPVHDQAIESSHRGAKRFFRSLAGRVEERREATVSLPVGVGELTVLLDVNGEPAAESSFTLGLAPGVAQPLDLTARRREIAATLGVARRDTPDETTEPHIAAPPTPSPSPSPAVEQIDVATAAADRDAE